MIYISKFVRYENYYTHIIRLYICIKYGYILYTIRIFMVYLFSNILYYSYLLLIFIYLQKLISYAISIQSPPYGKNLPPCLFLKFVRYKNHFYILQKIFPSPRFYILQKTTFISYKKSTPYPHFCILQKISLGVRIYILQKTFLGISFSGKIRHSIYRQKISENSS